MEAAHRLHSQSSAPLENFIQPTTYCRTREASSTRGCEVSFDTAPRRLSMFSLSALSLSPSLARSASRSRNRTLLELHLPAYRLIEWRRVDARLRIVMEIRPVHRMKRLPSTHSAYGQPDRMRARRRPGATFAIVETGLFPLSLCLSLSLLLFLSLYLSLPLSLSPAPRFPTSSSWTRRKTPTHGPT